jgi:hypothetical protein
LATQCARVYLFKSHQRSVSHLNLNLATSSASIQQFNYFLKSCWTFEFEFGHLKCTPLMVVLFNSPNIWIQNEQTRSILWSLATSCASLTAVNLDISPTITGCDSY